MKTNRWILGGLMAMAITACTSDELVENTNPTQGKKVTVTAYAPGNEANSRVSFDDDGANMVTLSWEDTENFSVVYHTTAQTFSKTTAGNTFTGVLPYDANNTQSKYYAVYPALRANTSLTTANTVPFDLSTQTGALDESKTYMYASSTDGLSYSFQHCTAILKATFSNDDFTVNTKIKEVKVKTSHPDSKVDGNLNLATGEISDGSKNTITIKHVEQDENGNTTVKPFGNPVYIYLPPMAAENKALTFEVITTDDKTYTGTLGAASTPQPSDGESSNANQGPDIEAGKLYTATIELEEVVSGDEIPVININGTVYALIDGMCGKEEGHTYAAEDEAPVIELINTAIRAGINNFCVINELATYTSGNVKKTVVGQAFINCEAADGSITLMFKDATNVPEGAFTSCKKLNSVSAPNAIYINEKAFIECSNITSINLPAATSIYGYAFQRCSNITSINLPLVTWIGDCAFQLCASITNLSLPMVTSIGRETFNSCYNLATLSFGSVIESVGTNPFMNVGFLDGCDLTLASGQQHMTNASSASSPGTPNGNPVIAADANATWANYTWNSITISNTKDLEYNATSNTFNVKTVVGLQHLNEWMTGAKTTSQFKALGYAGCDGIADNISAANRYAQNITLAADITLPTVDEGVSNWTPIGTKDFPYTGIFEGNNKTITNLTIYPGYCTYNNQYIGLIGHLQGHVRNLKLENVTIDGSKDQSYIIVGGIVGKMSENAQVSGCRVSGNLNDSGRASYIAGIVGFNASQNTGASISGCVNTADISGGQFVGGIVGYSKNSTVMQCENSGKVEFKTSGRAGNVGGIAGKIDENAIISSCVNRGIVKSEGASLGGIVGFTQNGTLVNCINMAPATATSPSLILSVKDDSSWLGGILGYSNGYTDKVIGCINHADMQYNYQNLSNNHDVNVGGIVGATNGDSFVACGNTGNITIELVGSSSYHKLNVGGICGSNSDKKFYGCWTNIVVEYNNNETEVALVNMDGFGRLNSPESKSDYIKECYTAASKSDDKTEEAFINGKVNNMNTALSNYGWQWVAGTNSNTDWPTLKQK